MFDAKTARLASEQANDPGQIVHRMMDVISTRAAAGFRDAYYVRRSSNEDAVVDRLKDLKFEVTASSLRGTAIWSIKW